MLFIFGCTLPPTSDQSLQLHDADAEVGNQIFHLWAPNDILQLSKSTLHHQPLSIVCMGSKKQKKSLTH